MSVNDALDIRAAQINRTMDYISGTVGFVFGGRNEITVEIHLQEVRRGDLVEHQPHWIDQEMVGLARYPRRIVRQDQIVPAEMRDQPIAGSEIDPHGPFLWSNVAGPCRELWFECVHWYFSSSISLAPLAGRGSR